MIRRFTARAKQAIELSRCEAVRWNHRYVGTEHLLLALVRDPQNLAAMTLNRMALTVNHVRHATMELVKPGADPDAK